MSSGTKKATPFWVGGAASCAAASITHPIDLLKVRIQTSQGPKQSYVAVISSIVKGEGIIGLYAGLSASILRQATYSTTRFGVYEELKKHLTSTGNMNFWTQLGSAVIGGTAGGIAGNPFDLANIRMQADSKLPPAERRNYKHAIDAFLRIRREEGTAALFTGLSPNIGRAIVMTSSQLVSYDVVKAQMLASGWFQDNVLTHFGASLLAGLIATTATSPVDVVKTRIMYSPVKGEYKGMIDAFVKIGTKEGPGAFFKGWLSAFIRLGPHTILTFVFFEQIKNLVTR
ncbi:mitochondrial dicarboxylate carrier-like protein [Gonapodya prolifera JEL478]|uniref:Mitochondrial dicarboxylate carrier-like protein n=1 Tax=Gonapodya prolifera (strain JEL478) TaxID=1344416 RepID=A0A139AL72_GONPJ|nr:mitochondrial dicarboxylate carrier-like protein [Gonapodya prolifera JEL478]|eukprot:KXS17542.1 mitochondrial dicarboxylate carrier-like protein [Gonapodya prolifera JEL478]